MCCSAVSQLLMLAKSIISTANKAQEEDVDDDMLNINWPEDSIEKAKIIRTRAQSMNGKVEAVCNSFITGMFVQHYSSISVSSLLNELFTIMPKNVI